jgi:hypothetical protein
MLHPVDHLAILSLLNGNVRHGRTLCGSVPVLLIGREPDHISWMDFLDRVAFSLCPPAACGNNERLSERMRVPGRPRTRLKCDTCTGDQRLCYVDGHNLGIAHRLDIAHRRLAKHAAIFPVELADTFVSNLVGCGRRIKAVRKHSLSCNAQP